METLKQNEFSRMAFLLALKENWRFLYERDEDEEILEHHNLFGNGYLDSAWLISAGKSRR